MCIIGQRSPVSTRLWASGSPYGSSDAVVHYRALGGRGAAVHPMIYTVIQQFGKDIISLAPTVIEAAQREVKVLRDPYVDKHIYWFGRGGEADIDAEEHRRYDQMTPAEKVRLTKMQAAGELGRWNAAKTKHRRPWTGVYGGRVKRLLPPDLPAAADDGPGSLVERVPGASVDPTLDAAPVAQANGPAGAADHDAPAPGQPPWTSPSDSPLDQRVATAMAAMKERHRRAAAEADRPRFRCSSCDHIFAGSRGTRASCPHCRTLLDLPS